MAVIRCPYCGKYYSPDYAKIHIRYSCKMSPDRDILVSRKKVLEKIDEMKKKYEEELREKEYYMGWVDALEWIIEIS